MKAGHKMFKVGQRVWVKEQKKVAEISLITKPHSTQYYMKDMQGFWFEDEINQSAQTMFEALGYEVYKKDSKVYFYKHRMCTITFDIENKEYWHSEESSITIEEHLAIHQQLIELGWLE